MVARVRRGRSTVRIEALAPPDTDQVPVGGVTHCMRDMLDIEPTERKFDRPLPKREEVAHRDPALPPSHRADGGHASSVIGDDLQRVPVGLRDYRIDMTDLRSALAAEGERNQHTVASWILAVG